MKPLQFLLAATLFPLLSAQAQEGKARVIEIVAEPHHTLLFQNDQVRVFRLKLSPGEATLPHRHDGFYAYVSLNPATIGNEVRGRQPVLTQLEPGELRTSKGGFNLAERNDSSEPIDLLVIEAVKAGSAGFGTPMGGFRFHDAAFGELFETPSVRGYAMTIASGGRTEQHAENFDRLLIAISDLNLREAIGGQAAAEFKMKAGETRWIPRGMTHATTNSGPSPATFITLEFN